jgi:ACT domain-containing protein
MRAFVTVIGKDKIGIIHSVTGVLRDAGVNVLDINQTLLQDYFTMIMLVDLSKMEIEFVELKNKLDLLGESLSLKIKLQHEDIFNSMHKI